MSSPLTDLIRPLLVFQGITALTGGGAGKLDGIATVDLTAGLSGFIVVGANVYFYQLTAGTDAEDSPNIIRPDDYAGGTNEKVWKLLPAVVAASSPYSFGHGDPPTDGSILTVEFWDLDSDTHFVNTNWPNTADPTWKEA